MPAARHRTITRDAVLRDYTPLAAEYEQRWRAFNTAARDWVLARWPGNLDATARVLDIGCGAGGLLAAVAARRPGARLVGLDITPALLAQARRTVPAAALIEGDAERPPFAGQSFDVICSLNILHHLNDPAGHLAALAKLCRPGGTVFLATFSGAHNLAIRLATAWLALRNPAWGRALSVAALRTMLANESGVTIAEHEQIRASSFWYLQLYRLTR